jgi:hypothetical protein
MGFAVVKLQPLTLTQTSCSSIYNNPMTFRVEHARLTEIT